MDSTYALKLLEGVAYFQSALRLAWFISCGVAPFPVITHTHDTWRAPSRILAACLRGVISGSNTTGKFKFHLVYSGITSLASYPPASCFV